MNAPTLRALLLVFLVPAHAIAADYWVDAVNGNNANGGSSPSDAWRTLTRAMTAPAGGTVHVLPGRYDAALGETFPLTLRADLVLHGEEGPSVTVVESGGDALRAPAGGHYVLNRLTIRSGGTGLFAHSTGSILTVDCTEMRFEGGVHGIDFLVGNWTCFGLGNALRLDRVEVEGCAQNGVRVSGANCSDNDVILTDCLLRGNGINGLFVSAPSTSDEIYFYPVVTRTRFLDNGVHGFQVDPVAVDVQVVVEDSLFAGNQVGLARDSVGTFGSYPCAVSRCTFTGNGVGYRINNHSPADRLEESILYGNGDDLLRSGGADPLATSNNIGDGDYVGMDGNISVDPLFRRPDLGDFRLGFGTGCVDAVAGGSTGQDLSGFERGNDGDLDLVGASDMGAYELRTLSAPQTVGIGDKLHLDIHAEPQSFTVLWLARGPLLPVPDPTPFGDRWLPAPLLELVATRKVLTPNPVRHTVYVPNDPVLIGQLFSFQALSRSSAAPAGAAWTDALTAVVVP